MALPTVGKLKLDKASVTVVPGKQGSYNAGTVEEPNWQPYAPDAVQYLHVELPQGEPCKLVLESGASKQTLCELAGPKPELGKATVVQIRIRARTDGEALAEPTAAEAELGVL